MRFCDFFISYKIGLKSIENTIPFTKLPLYRKIVVIVTFALTIISVLLFVLKLLIPGCSVLVIDIISLEFFSKLIQAKTTLNLCLKNITHRIPKNE